MSCGIQVPLLEPGDIIIDGGNSEYTDTTVYLYITLYILLLFINNQLFKQN